jgi:hypothetical protein
VYARPQVNGTPTTLGVSGMLWRDALVMYDRATRSLWSQVNGKAVAGPMKGKRLDDFPSTQTTWGAWKRRHPDTLVLVKPRLAGSPYDSYFDDPQQIGVRGSRNPDTRLSGKELILGLEHEGRFAAVPLSLLRKQPVISTEALGLPVVISKSAAFQRRVDERTLTFEKVEEPWMRDRETNSLWSIETGAAIAGPMKSKHLQRISAKVVYWAVWARFHPETEVFACNQCGIPIVKRSDR